jgi:cysteinyl-tRNA synthetase
MFYVLGLDIPYVKMDENDKKLYQNYLKSKENKDFVLSDKLRQELIEKGIM